MYVKGVYYWFSEFVKTGCPLFQLLYSKVFSSCKVDEFNKKNVLTIQVVLARNELKYLSCSGGQPKTIIHCLRIIQAFLVVRVEHTVEVPFF